MGASQGCIPALLARTTPGITLQPGIVQGLAPQRGGERGAFRVEFTAYHHARCVRCDDLFMQGKAKKTLPTEQRS